jgi:hypothetical protein
LSPSLFFSVFCAVIDLKAAISAYLAEHSASPKPLGWTKSADVIGQT